MLPLGGSTCRIAGWVLATAGPDAAGGAAPWVGGCDTGASPFEFAARPIEIVGTAARRVDRLALDQHVGRGRIAVSRAGAGRTHQLVGVAGRCRHRKRDHGPGHRTRRRLARRAGRRRRGDRSARQRHRSTVAHVAADFAFDVVRQLPGAGLGEIDAVGGAQAAHLAFIVGTEGRELSGVVDEAVPDIDVDDTGAFGALTIEVVEIKRIGGRLGTADRRQPDPEHRHAFALERGNGLIDALGINGSPLVATEFEHAGRRRFCFGFRCGDGLVFRLVLRRLVALFLIAILLVAGLLTFGLLFFRLLGEIFFPDVLAVADADHHDDVVRLLLGEDVAHDMPPIEVALGVVAQQA